MMKNKIKCIKYNSSFEVKYQKQNTKKHLRVLKAKRDGMLYLNAPILFLGVEMTMMMVVDVNNLIKLKKKDLPILLPNGKA